MNSTLGITIDGQIVTVSVENYTINTTGVLTPGIHVKDFMGRSAILFKENANSPVMDKIFLNIDNPPVISREYIFGGYHCEIAGEIKKIESPKQTQLVKIFNACWIDSNNGYFDIIREFKKTNRKSDFLISLDKDATLIVKFRRWLKEYKF